jgi:hypothetical protein
VCCAQNTTRHRTPHQIHYNLLVCHRAGAIWAAVGRVHLLWRGLKGEAVRQHNRQPKYDIHDAFIHRNHF